MLEYLNYSPYTCQRQCVSGKWTHRCNCPKVNSQELLNYGYIVALTVLDSASSICIKVFIYSIKDQIQSVFSIYLRMAFRHAFELNLILYMQSSNQAIVLKIFKSLCFLMPPFHQGLFCLIDPIWTRLSPINQFFDAPDCRSESPPIVSPFLTRLSPDYLNASSRSRNHFLAS